MNMADVSVEAAGITGLSIKWASGTVRVIVVDDATMAIGLTETAAQVLDEEQRLRWRMVGSTLEIHYGSWLECMMVWHKDLEVRIPRAFANAFGQVSIEGSSGSYSVSDLGCEALKLKLASGRIDVDRVVARRLHVDVASGRVSAAGRFDESVSVRAASGKAWALCEGVCPRSIDVDVASGAVHVALAATAGFTAQVTKASGKFSSGFPLERTASGYRHADGSARIRARMASGSFSLDSVG